MATQSYSGILFPIEAHLVLFCKYLKRREFARSFDGTASALLQQTLVLDVLKQNPQSQLQSSARRSGYHTQQQSKRLLFGTCSFSFTLHCLG